MYFYINLWGLTDLGCVETGRMLLLHKQHHIQVHNDDEEDDDVQVRLGC